MGWKTINGSRYYYRSVRDGGRVRTEYVGAGQTAGLIARIEQLESLERAEQREAEREQRERDDGEEQEFRAWFERVETYARAVLLAAGFHRHKGQWRRRRNGRDR